MLTRETVSGTRHAISAGHYLASAAGFSVLEAGGNAVDAGCAAGLALGVLHPDLVSIAGVAPILLRTAAGTVESIAGVGPWPAATDAAFFQRAHGGKMPAGVLRTVVPAAPCAFITALQRHGSMAFSEIAAHAIRFAAEGFAVYPLLAENIANHAAEYRRWPQNAAIFLPGGAPPAEGDRFLQADLAATLRFMADEERAALSRGADRVAGLEAARDAFYRGDIAARMVDFIQAEGGWLSREDLARFRCPVAPPVSIAWRGQRVFTGGPWCQGPTLLQALLMAERAGLAALPHNAPDYLHLMAELLKIAFADREHHVGDPDFVAVPLSAMLSDAHIAARVAQIDPGRAHPGMMPALLGTGRGQPAASLAADPPVEAGTSYVAVVDRWGGAFSCAPSDASWSSPVIPGLGFVPSNRGSQNRTDPAHPAGLAPGKRPRLTPMPALALGADGSVMPFGSPGNDVQPQALLQVLMNLFVHGMTPQAAVEAPRIASYAFPGTSAPHDHFPARLAVESRIPEAVRDALAARGHAIRLWPERTWLAGCVELVRKDPARGLIAAAADPRRPAAAIAL
ncbi:gamma-glutamyltransferase family protein [Falsiroseomonas selenitidurans]|uniref:Gamma-glutamyltransferase family protein n=1 Tax=Falsiroseomonas selenitidurans TaxID=2716335 RepID=A0ABX1DZG9_9PROT|nr:gamma-glutamyltransferase [Falsiroseomonas selenitidurans]NKC30304.1 gamma-glutamyltransferase family protein [Falsiroseomonas selenitidurans]